jgi:hypothetical protein
MLKVNDRVCYSHNFLKSIQADKDIADMRGTVMLVGREIKKGLFHVKVQWDNETELSGAISKNLALIRDGQLYDAE